MSSIKSNNQLRMRVFAGPNGSGKSTIIKSVRKYKTTSGKLDFGIYVNADDIVSHLKKKSFKFTPYQIEATEEEFKAIALASGLIDENFTKAYFLKSFKFSGQRLQIHNVDLSKKEGQNTTEKLGQIIADYLRKKLLSEKKKFSFETVFSHESKIDIMKQAKEAGYKVYLYFVSTNSPEINKERVLLRVKEGGHDVDPDKIESRYYRSLDLLYKAAQYTYQTYFFDNSDKTELFGFFKVINDKKEWKLKKGYSIENLPNWFIEYYAKKIKR